MDESLYDEFGNYIGPELSGSEVCKSLRDKNAGAMCKSDMLLRYRAMSAARQDEEEQEELDEMAEDLEEEEEAANRRMDMTSTALGPPPLLTLTEVVSCAFVSLLACTTVHLFCTHVCFQCA